MVSAFCPLALPKGEKTDNDLEPLLRHLNIGAV